MKEIIAILILASILVMSSCEYLPFLSGNEQSGTQSNSQGDEFVDGNHPYHYLFPEGYTGGFHHQPGANIEYWWVETYEECLAAIELLKSHDSSFSTDLVLTYDGELFDSKYCFMFIGVGSRTDKIKWGDNPFDRYAENVNIRTFAFFEDVSIDKLNHSYVDKYDTYEYAISQEYDEIKDDIAIDTITISEWIKGSANSYKPGFFDYSRKASFGEQDILYVEPCSDLEEGYESEFSMTYDCIRDMVSLGRVIELNDKGQ